VLRKEHWLHHLRPHAYVAAPAWLSGLLHLIACTTLVAAGPFGAGLFLGLEAGYLAYVATHDAIHHCYAKPLSWLRRKQMHHDLHHQGEEVNFGVFSHFWDKRFGTYWDPRKPFPRMQRPARGT
jgi:cyclopropane-fatty-acyl-phospholipid synthase